MTLKYLLILTALFAFSACGAKPEQKGKGHRAADTTVMARQERTAVSSAAPTGQANTLPSYIDRYTKSDSALVCQLLREFAPQRQQLTNEELVIKGQS